MSRLRQLSVSVGATLAFQALTVGVSVGLLALFSRSFTKPEMALYALMGAFQGILRLASGFGIGTLAVREVPGLTATGRPEEARRLISSCVVYSTVCSVVLGGMLVLAAPSLSRAFFGSADLAGRVRLVCVAAFVLRLTNGLSLMQWALQRFSIRAFCGTMNSLGARSLAAGGYLLFGFEGFVLAFVLMGAVTVGVHAWTMRREWTAWLLPIRPLLRRSRGYIPVDALRSLYAGVDRPVVGLFLGPEVLAGYFVTLRCATFLIRAIRALSAPLGAKLSEVRHEGAGALNQYFNRSLFAMAIVFVPVGCAMAAMSRPALRLIAGEGYAHCWPILVGLSVLVACRSIADLCYDAIFRLTAVRYLMLLNAVMCAGTLGLYCVLLPFLGAPGVPLASAAACLGATVWAVGVLRRRAGIVMQWDGPLRALACGLAVSVAARVALAASAGGMWLWVVTFTLVAPVYVVASWTVASPEMRAFARARLAAVWTRIRTSAYAKGAPAIAVPRPRGDSHA